MTGCSLRLLIIGDGWWRCDRRLFLRERKGKIRNGQKQNDNKELTFWCHGGQTDHGQWWWQTSWIRMASAGLVDHMWLLLVDEFVAVPKKERKCLHRQTSTTKTYLGLPVVLDTARRQTGHGDADEDDDKLDGVMRRVDDPGTMSLGGETEKREVKRSETCGETQHKRTADDTRCIAMCVVGARAQMTKVGLSRFFAFLGWRAVCNGPLNFSNLVFLHCDQYIGRSYLLTT